MDIDYARYGYLRARALAPVVALADPEQNAAAALEAMTAAERDGVGLLLLPELALTGYTVEDLQFSATLQQEVEEALHRLANASKGHALTTVIGTPFHLPDGRLLNTAMVIADGRIRGGVAKQHLPNYAEFYDQRWFTATGETIAIRHAELGEFTISPRQLFVVGTARVAIEICEDLWAPEPPGAAHAVAGADIIVNPSASTELVAKSDYRRDLVRMSSAQRICGYLYVSSGPTESTKDVVFGGHGIACEDGLILGESERFRLDGASVTAEFDIQKLRHDRAHNTTFGNARRPGAYAEVLCAAPQPMLSLHREYDRHPFVPKDETEFDARAAEIMHIQAIGLARRMMAARCNDLVIGLSGGLDSTLAFLVSIAALELRDLAVEHLHAITMPGPGTSGHTLASARSLAEAVGAPLEEIDIGPAVKQHLEDLKHAPHDHDVTFENAQARERTQILFNLANQRNALVVGTGDLSELALGWCTYNADHMASYNVNASVPKTMIRYLVRWYAIHKAGDALPWVLNRVLETPISPELVPGEQAELSQLTEEIIGPYELHDFFLFHLIRNGFSAAKVFHLSCRAFAGAYEPDVVNRWLRTFISRFFAQQFKRSVMPPGPKVGSVSLSPRGDWRMPDEASARAWLDELPPLA